MKPHKASNLLSVVCFVGLGFCLGILFCSWIRRNVEPTRANDVIAHKVSGAATKIQDVKSQNERDVGPRGHEFGRPARGTVSSIELGQTGFQATTGPSKYTDEEDEEWDFYSIEVQKPNADGTVFDVYFSRQFEVDQLEAELLTRRAAELVGYDAETNTVTFNLGSIVEKYKIPGR